MIRLIIDGIDQTENSNLETVSTIIGLNTSTETFNLESSGLNINLRNEAATQIKELFIDNCEYPPNVVNVSLITDYGNFEFTLLPSNANWCNDCTADIILTSANNDELCYNRLNNTPVLNDDLWSYMITKNKWKLVPYSNDTTVFSLAAIELLNIITLLPNLLIWNRDVKLVQQWSLYSTGRWHAALKVTDILEYYAEKCGRTFKSTLLQSSPYNRMYILPSASAPGAFYLKDTRDMTLERSDKYRMEFTVVQLLDVLNEMFFAEWRISENDIIFEPVENIKDDAVQVGVLDPIERVCINQIKYDCAKLSFEYALDYTDAAGDVERDAYVYVHDYQQNNRALTELCRVSIPFSIATNTRGRHAVDGVSAFRSPGSIPVGEFGDFLGIELALSRNASALPKFLINRQFEEDSQNYLIQEAIKVGDPKGNQFISNPQISFNPEVPGNLYDLRHYKRNPSEGVIPCKESASITVCFSAELLTNMRAAFAAGKTAYITSDYGNMYFTSAEVIFGVGQRITLNNIKIYN